MDDYKYYRVTEKRLYTYRTEQARRNALLVERKNILDRTLDMPSIGVVSYGEHIGRASESLTEPEKFAEQGLKNCNRLWQINREIDDIDARTHILDYAIAVLSNRERDIVRARYFDGMDLAQVARLCCYSERQVRNIKSAAVRKIGSVLYGE